MPPTPPICLMLCKVHDPTWRRVSRAGTGGVTDSDWTGPRMNWDWAWSVTESEDRTWPRVSRAGAGRVTEPEDWTWLRVSRAGAWRVTELEDWTWPRVGRAGAWRVTESEDRTWPMLRTGRLTDSVWGGPRLTIWLAATNLGRISWSDSQTDQTAGSDRPGHLTRMSRSPKISRWLLLLEYLHLSEYFSCCCLLSLPFSRLFPTEIRARLVVRARGPYSQQQEPQVTLWILALELIKQ